MTSFLRTNDTSTSPLPAPFPDKLSIGRGRAVPVLASSETPSAPHRTNGSSCAWASRARRLTVSLSNCNPTLITHMSIRTRQSNGRDSLSPSIDDDAHNDFLTHTHDIHVSLSHARHSFKSQGYGRSSRPTSPRPSSFRSYSPLIPIAPRHPTPGQLHPSLPPIYPAPRAASGGLQPNDSTRSYHLEVVQQPVVAAEFGSLLLSRLPLAPPPVAQLIVRDGRGHVVDDDPDLGFFIAHLALYSADGRHELDAAPPVQGRHFPPNRLLYGTIVSSPHFLRNLQNRPGVFFIFPDVSVHRAGRYTLKIFLARLSEPSFMATRIVHEGEMAAPIAHATTSPFEVVPREDYVAPAQTRLTEYFLAQGARIRL